MTALRTCQCWRIEWRDGQVFGLTDHDEDLLVAGDLYRAADALTPSEARSVVGFEVDEMEVQGCFSSGSITESALENGEFDGAEVWVHRVDWADPASRAAPELQARFRIGRTTRARQGDMSLVRSTQRSFTGRECRGPSRDTLNSVASYKMTCLQVADRVDQKVEQRAALPPYLYRLIDTTMRGVTASTAPPCY